MTNSRVFVFLLSVVLGNVQIQGQSHLPFYNITYGDDPRQIIDVYLPIGHPVEKVILLIHGGAWAAGDKEDMNGWLGWLAADYPSYCIANMNYRLGTVDSPAHPKQLEDIHLVMTLLQWQFGEEVTVGLIGGSAGAHLAMMYAYSMDSHGARVVRTVVSMVGPTDFNDSNYVDDPLFLEFFFPLVGNCTYYECPDRYNATSPASFVHHGAPPTIGFYGNLDILIPNTQMPTLRDKLEVAGVVNKFTVYNGGHGDDWPWEYYEDLFAQMKEFWGTNWL